MINPYRSIPIEECGEPLAPIPKNIFAFFGPHPYMALGAPYGGASPWMLRKGVLERLEKIQARLQIKHPGWKLMIFDAYRPVAVQAFMVEHEYKIQAKAAGLHYATLTPAQREELGLKVFRLWGTPSDDPAKPPPHSTGAALDVTLADKTGKEVDMGSPIDENSDRSNPDYFAEVADKAGQRAHASRCLLRELMHSEDFYQNSTEWWHFSRGDQMWANGKRRNNPASKAVAIYGRADLLK